MAAVAGDGALNSIRPCPPRFTVDFFEPDRRRGGGGRDFGGEEIGVGGDPDLSVGRCGRDQAGERMIPLPVIGHWLKKGWGAYFKLSKLNRVPRLPGL